MCSGAAGVLMMIHNRREAKDFEIASSTEKCLFNIVNVIFTQRGFLLSDKDKDKESRKLKSQNILRKGGGLVSRTTETNSITEWDDVECSHSAPRVSAHTLRQRVHCGTPEKKGEQIWRDHWVKQQKAAAPKLPSTVHI